MKRCFELALKADSAVKTNPKVGCVIVYKDQIIGEGWHKAYGGPHAEINAISSIKEEDLPYLAQATMYVSLEPCHHHGKTPPCVDAILHHKVPRVVLSCQDPNPLTSGKSITKLKHHGVQVTTDVLKEEGSEVIAPFIVQQLYNRPYITLKWAQSKDLYLGAKDKQIWLSNEISRWMVHRWRSEIDAILVGTDTAIIDNPELTNRRGHGRNPVRILLDRQGRVPLDRKLLADEHHAMIITSSLAYPSLPAHKEIIVIQESDWSWQTILSTLYEKKVGQIMIEGGKSILASLIKAELWDEARIIHTPKLLGEGIRVPYIKGKLVKKYKIRGDKAFIIKPYTSVVSEWLNKS